MSKKSNEERVTDIPEDRWGVHKSKYYMINDMWFTSQEVKDVILSIVEYHPLSYFSWVTYDIGNHHLVEFLYKMKVLSATSSWIYCQGPNYYSFIVEVGLLEKCKQEGYQVDPQFTKFIKFFLD